MFGEARSIVSERSLVRNGTRRKLRDTNERIYAGEMYSSPSEVGSSVGAVVVSGEDASGVVAVVGVRGGEGGGGNSSDSRTSDCSDSSRSRATGGTAEAGE